MVLKLKDLGLGKKGHEGGIDNITFPLARTIALFLPVLIAVLLPIYKFYSKFDIQTANNVRYWYVIICTILIMLILWFKEYIIRLFVTDEILKGEFTESEIEILRKTASGEILVILSFFSFSFLISYLILDYGISRQKKFYTRAGKLKIAESYIDDARRLSKSLRNIEDNLSDITMNIKSKASAGGSGKAPPSYEDVITGAG